MRFLGFAFGAAFLACARSGQNPALQRTSPGDTLAQRSRDTPRVAVDDSAPSLVDNDSQPSNLTMVRIEAHLVFDDGQVSEDIIGPHPWVLWNTIIGEGEAQRPSHETLVRVLFAAPPGSLYPGSKVQLDAAGPTPVGWVAEKPLTAFDSTGRQYVSFRLADTGCEKIGLVARLVSDSVRDSLSAEIPFECGE